MPVELKPDRLLTLHEAAAELGFPYYKVQRAVRHGYVPSYSLFNSRRYVRMSELLEVMATNPMMPVIAKVPVE